MSDETTELREAARSIQGNLGRCLYRHKDVDEMRKVSDLLFEAASTIESLRDKLQAATLGSDAKPCYATDYTHEHCKYSVNRGWVENVELGSGTCEMETDWDYLHDGIPDAPEDTWAYKCSACGWSFRYDRGIKPNFCPNCCARVKAVER